MEIDELFFVETIHEVSIGTDPMTDFRFTVGQTRRINGKSVEICEILYSKNAQIAHGNTLLMIYVKTEDGEVKPWKISVNQPVMITAKV